MIRLPDIHDEIQQGFWDNQYKVLLECLEKNENQEEFRKIVSYFFVDGKPCNERIKSLLIGNIESIKEIINGIGECKKIRNKASKLHNEFDNLYEKFCKENGYWLTESLGVTVCPYCNRNYIFTIKGKKIRPQFDHYFPKSLYPYLAISLYNLIPCCPICNQKKATYDTNKKPFVYPYSDEYGYDTKFHIDYKSVQAIAGYSSDFDLNLDWTNVEDDKKKEEQTNSQLAILELYRKHTIDIKNIVLRSHIYNDDYIYALTQQFPQLFPDYSSVSNFIYGNTLEKDEWKDHPLSKLTYDIVKQIKG